jgi:seryl-tRNA synthetase
MVRWGALTPQCGLLVGQLTEMLLGVPNTPYKGVPDGVDETSNVEVSRWGEVPKFDFKVLDHVDLGAGLSGMDFAMSS